MILPSAGDVFYQLDRKSGSAGGVRVIIVLMGPCGCGKTTVGAELARKLDAPFLEGDTYHPPENRAKMAAGTPLNDADRWPWLDRIAETVKQQAQHCPLVVVACSALKRRYRDRLRRTGLPTRFVHLSGSYELLHERLMARRDHFMPPAMLDSQLAVLEPPQAEEGSISICIETNPQAQAETIVSRLGL